MLTLTSILLPSLNIIGSIFGPRTAGVMGIVWGPVMVIASAIVFLSQKIQGLEADSRGVVPVFLFGFGVAIFILGSMMMTTQTKEKQEQKNANKMTITNLRRTAFIVILFPLLLPASPLIRIVIFLLRIFKPKNKLLWHQYIVGRKANAIFEAAPQNFLQCYII